MILKNLHYITNKEDYADTLHLDLAEEYASMTDEEYDAMIDQKVSETVFVKAIVIYMGQEGVYK